MGIGLLLSTVLIIFVFIGEIEAAVSRPEQVMPVSASPEELPGKSISISEIPGEDIPSRESPGESPSSDEASGESASPDITPRESVFPSETPREESPPGESSRDSMAADEKEVIPEKGENKKGDEREELEEIRIRQILDQMDLKDKVYQMFIVFADTLTGASNTTIAGEATKKALKKYPVGGILYLTGNLKSEDQAKAMLQGIQSFSEVPLFLASDEEGGRVARVKKALGTYEMKAMFYYKDQGSDLAYDNARQIAKAIHDLGFNTAFAPVADVWSYPENTVIADRAYSDDFEEAAKLIPAAVQGFQDGGVVCSLKHFPGHGSTKSDSHHGSAYVYKTLEELRKEEFLPFQAGIDAGADMVMVGHLLVPEIDDVPATISPKIITDILRNELNYSGVVITDALNMKAMTDYYGSGEIAVRSVKAGADILLCPADLERSANALLQAVQKGEITQERIDESVKRILHLKLQRGIIP